MDASLFIARRLRFKGKFAMVSVAVSFLVMIIAVAVSSGFRHEIRDALSSLSGDIQLLPASMNVLDGSSPVEKEPSYLPYVTKVRGVETAVPVVYRAGIVRNGDNIHGVLFKGIDSLSSLSVSIPVRLSEITGLGIGDKMTAYFIGEDMKVRQFVISSMHESLVEADDKLVVYAGIADLQRLNGWKDSQVSCFEIMLDDDSRADEDIVRINEEIGTKVYAYGSEDEESVVAVSSLSRYPQLYDWMNLIDFNVIFILILMTIVAGFNMISGLLIMLFENISTIGLLKSLGMTDNAISKVFLSTAAVLVLKGLALGNFLAILFCFMQDKTHLLRLNPENYFVSFVPVNVDLWLIMLADVAAFLIIMLILLIPCIFISKVDPADTVRVK